MGGRSQCGYLILPNKTFFTVAQPKMGPLHGSPNKKSPLQAGALLPAS